MLEREQDEAGFVVELDRFHGPLDLLLHLIREQDIDIFDIPIARITEQFLAAIRGVDQMGLDRAGEFLEMAAMLIRIKAQMLLPRRVDEAGELEDPRAELVKRLLEYEHFREVAHRLEDSEADRARHYGRGYLPPRPRPDPAEIELDVGWDELWEALLLLADRAPGKYQHVISRRVVTMEEKVQLILRVLGDLSKVEFRDLVGPKADKLHAVMTLLAGLELAKQRDLAMRQSAPFAPLWLYRRNGEETDADNPDH